MVTKVDAVVEGQEEGVGISTSSVSPILERESCNLQFVDDCSPLTYYINTCGLGKIV